MMRPQDSNRPLDLLLLLMGLILLVLAHFAHPFVLEGFNWRLSVVGFSTAGFARSLIISTLLFLAAIAAGGGLLVLGIPCCGWLGLASGTKTSGTMTFGFDSLGCGLLIGSLVVFGFGLTGLLFPAIAVGVPVAFVSFLLLTRRRCQISSSFGTVWLWLKAATVRARIPGLLWAFAPGLLMLPALPWIVAAPLLPPVNVDILEYHLGLPVHWVGINRIDAFPGNILFQMPLGFERLAVPFILLGLSGVIPAFYIVLLGVAAFGFAAMLREAGSSYATIGGWLVFGCGAVLTLAADGHPDTGLILAAALGVLALSRGSCVGFGVACALAVVSKYQGVALALSFLLAAMFYRRGGRRMAASGAMASIALGAPWLIKNWLDTGNPVYPFGFQWLPSLHWGEWNARVLWGSMQHASVLVRWVYPDEAVAEYLTALWRGIRTIWLTPYSVLLYLAPLIWLRARRGSLVAALAMQAFILTLGWIAPAPKFGRYLLPAVVPVLGAFLLSVGRESRRSVNVVLAFLLLVESLAFVAQFRRVRAPAEGVLFGAMSQSEYRKAVFGEYWSAVEWINAACSGIALDRRNRVMVVGQGHGYGIVAPVIANNETGIPAYLLVLGQVARADRMRIRMKQAGVRWVFYNPVRAYHRSSFAWGHQRTEDWWAAYSRFWREWAPPVRVPLRFDWTGAWYVYSIRDRALVKSEAHAWLPGGEQLVQDEGALMRGEVDEARMAMQQRVMGEFGIARLQRAMVAFFVRRDSGAAIRLAREAVEGGLETPGACNTLGYFLWSADREREAGRWFRRALELDPEFTQARDNLVELRKKKRPQ